MGKLILVLGLTGAGKTTYCDELAAKENAIIFSIDRWMKCLYWQDMPSNPDMQWFVDNSAWYQERIARCEAFMKEEIKSFGDKGISIILDLGFTAILHRMEYLLLAAGANLESELHFLDVPKDERWKRVEERNQNRGVTYSMTVTREMFDYIESIFEPVSESERILCKKFLHIKR